jgi:hypothetical protein
VREVIQAHKTWNHAARFGGPYQFPWCVTTCSCTNGSSGPTNCSTVFCGECSCERAESATDDNVSKRYGIMVGPRLPKLNFLALVTSTTTTSSCNSSKSRLNARVTVGIDLLLTQLAHPTRHHGKSSQLPQDRPAEDYYEQHEQSNS